MKLKQVTDIYGNKVTIDVDKQEVYKFDNKNETITYCARMVENGEHVALFTYYKEKGIVTDVETKIDSFGNTIAFTYAKAIDFYASKNDPERKLWKKVVKHVEDNQERYFDEYGDFKDGYTYGLEDIKALVNG